MAQSESSHLAKAKEYIARGEEFYRKAADEMVAARKEDPTLGYRTIGEWVGRDAEWCRRLVQWRTSAEDIGTTPWAGQYGERLERMRKQAVEQPVEIVEAIRQAPEEAQKEIAKQIAEDDSGFGRAVRKARHEYHRDMEARGERRMMERPSSRRLHDSAELATAMNAMSHVQSRLREAIASLKAMTRDLREDERAEMVADVAEAQEALDWLREALESGNFDEELAALLEENS